MALDRTVFTADDLDRHESPHNVSVSLVCIDPTSWKNQMFVGSVRPSL